MRRKPVISSTRRGAKVEFLEWIVQCGGEVAGALRGIEDTGIVKHLERLRLLGLVFHFETERQAVYSAHPFLREFFRNLSGTKPASVHESVRAKLAPTLSNRPTKLPADIATLDQYELLIEETLLSGRGEEAFDLYKYGLGEHKNLIWVLGELRRLRIVERFSRKTIIPALGRSYLRLPDHPCSMNLEFLPAVWATC